MSLLSIFESAPESVANFTIEQVVSAAGSGVLRDDSQCSAELRGYLGKVATGKIAAYVDQCLNSAFAKGGMVLQDLINELGRRLDYEVTDGRYQGVQGQVGFDGLWLSPEGHSLVVEVKTTDAYRLSLDTLAAYRSKLADAGKLSANSSILIVVGRQDTGELEAQIRGSRHAWDVRVISAEALIKLVLLKENTEANESGLKMRSLLTPIEYTRLDRMVDVMFTTATDTEEEPAADEVAVPIGDGAYSAGIVEDPVIDENGESGVPSKRTWHFTDAHQLQAKREKIVAALSHRESVSLVKKSRALYWNAARDVRVACAMSKKYSGKNQAPYWYAYHPQWDEFLGEVERSFFVLGCMDRDEAYAIPQARLRGVLSSLNTTTKPAGMYWHIHLLEHGGALWMAIPKAEPLALEPFRFRV